MHVMVATHGESTIPASTPVDITESFGLAVMDRLAADVKDIGQLLHTQIPVVGAHHVEASAAAQCKQIIARIAATTNVNTSNALLLTSAIQEGPWSPEQKTSMIDSVNHRLVSVVDGQHSPDTKRPLQTMTTFTEYLRQADVELLTDGGVHIMTKLTHACTVLWKVGLYMPTEATIRHVVSVVVACHKGDFSGSQTYSMVQEFKNHIRSKAGLKHLPRLDYHISQYPGSPAELKPDLYKFAYADSPPSGFKFDGDLTKIAAGVAIRKNSRLVTQQAPSTSSTSSTSQQGLAHINPQAAVQFLSNMLMMAGGLGMNVPSPSLQILSPAAPRSRNILALSDAPPLQNTATPTASPPTLALTAPPVLPATASKDDDPAAASLFDLPDPDKSSKLTAAAQATIISGALAARAEERKAMKRPAAAAEAEDAPEPKMPKKQGEPAAHYNGGKILRSDTQLCWRVFLKATDKPDKRVPFNGNPSKAWIAAMRMIDDHASK